MQESGQPFIFLSWEIHWNVIDCQNKQLSNLVLLHLPLQVTWSFWEGAWKHLLSLPSAVPRPLPTGIYRQAASQATFHSVPKWVLRRINNFLFFKKWQYIFLYLNGYPYFDSLHGIQLSSNLWLTCWMEQSNVVNMTDMVGLDAHSNENQRNLFRLFSKLYSKNLEGLYFIN